MLKNQWTDAAFGFASLNDRAPVAPEDDIVVLAAPDPQGADEAIRISQGARCSARMRMRGLAAHAWQHGAPVDMWGAAPACPAATGVPAAPARSLLNPCPPRPAGLAEGQCMVMFNPRLASGDVGVGLSIRRMRDSFLSRFTTTYSLRPIADVGSVFRCYPGMWQVRRADGWPLVWWPWCCGAAIHASVPGCAVTPACSCPLAATAPAAIPI